MATVGPFPGMDPWLEPRWGGIHHGLIGFIQEQLNDQLPPGLVARVEERVQVTQADGHSRDVVPDVYVARSARGRAAPAGGTAAATLDEPYLVRIPSEAATEGYIQIVSKLDGERVVTAVEVLSATNKLDPRARQAYVRKREEYQAARVSTVEIDLLRAGEPIVEVPPEHVPPDLRAPYSVCVRRGWTLPSFEVEYYPVRLRGRLPRFAIPLRERDADVGLDLQAAFEAVYRRARCADDVDYDRPLDPPLTPEDAAWARERIDAWRKAAAGPAAG
ncbi:MAG TPA: DUF4058 family protein [Humisphaera sp.]